MALEEQELNRIQPDHLAPAAIEAKAEAVAVTKAAMPAGRMFVSAMLAGAFIAFGATYFLTFLGDTGMPFAVQRIVGGICFCLGLVLVLCCGSELFTGNCLMICGKLSDKIRWGGMLRNWVIVYFGNMAGALVIVFLVFMANTMAMGGGGVGDAMVSVAASKITPNWWTLMFKGILCNTLVCLAVWIGFASRTIVDKVVGIILPISAFVAIGFEHSVANMFFLPMGWAAQAAGYGTATAFTIDFAGILYNLTAVTIGNIIGGCILVGCAYWFAYRKRS